MPSEVWGPGDSPDERAKFDKQFRFSREREDELGKVFIYDRIEKVELKTETHIWDRTGNICVEWGRWDQRRERWVDSGINVTEADHWVQDLGWRDRRGRFHFLCYLMFQTGRLWRLAKHHFDLGHTLANAGDGGRQQVVLVPIHDLLCWPWPKCPNCGHVKFGVRRE